MQTLMEALPPELLKVKSQAPLLDRAADNIKTGCKISNPPKRVAVKLTNATLSNDPAMASTLGEGSGGLGWVERPLEEVLGENVKISYFVLAACGCEGLRLMPWG